MTAEKLFLGTQFSSNKSRRPFFIRPNSEAIIQVQMHKLTFLSAADNSTFVDAQWKSFRLADWLKKFFHSNKLSGDQN